MLAENFQLINHFVEGVLREFDQSEHHHFEEEAEIRPYVISQGIDHDRGVYVKITQKRGFGAPHVDQAWFRLKELTHKLSDLELLKITFTATRQRLANGLKQFTMYFAMPQTGREHE